jgi:hypothetical protein
MKYEITDKAALQAAFPQLFKSVPDALKIRKAISIGLTLPGVTFIEETAEQKAPAETGSTELNLNNY